MSVIEEIDGETPFLSLNTGLVGLGSSDSGAVLDFEKKNKELYIASGKGSAAKWLGYTKNQGWEGESGEYRLVAENALDVVSSSQSPQQEAFDKSCVLRGGEADTKDAKVIVGINTENDRAENAVYIYNMPDEKLFKFNCTTQPLAIKRWYGKNTGSPDYYCDGFAVMRVADQEGDTGVWGCTIDLWDLNTSGGGTVGQNANLYCTFHVKSPAPPEDGDLKGKMTCFGDFLIVPKYAEGSDDYSLSAQRYDLVFSRFRSLTYSWQVANSKEYEWLWKIGGKTLSEIENQGKVWNWDDHVNVTPKYQSDENSSTGVRDLRQAGEWFYAMKSKYGTYTEIEYQGSTHQTDTYYWLQYNFLSHGTSSQMAFQEAPALHNLELCGYDSDGNNPLIGFTVKHSHPVYKGTKRLTAFERDHAMSHAEDNDYDIGTDKQPFFGPFLSDRGALSGTNAQKNAGQGFRGVRWGTYFIPISTTGSPAKQKLFLHNLDWNAGDNLQNLTNALWINTCGFHVPSWLTGPSGDGAQGTFCRTSVPSSNPLFGIDGRFTCLTEGTKKTRALLSYVRPGSRKCLTFRFGEEATMPGNWTSSEIETAGLFPSDWSLGSDTAYHRFKNHTDDTGEDTSTSVYGSSDTGGKKSATLPTIDGAGHDKLSYRISEGPFKILLSQFHQDGNNATWAPNSNQRRFVSSVPIQSHEIKALYSAPMDGATAVTNAFPSNSTPAFTIDTPTTNSDVWGGIGCQTVFYKATFIYDGYQESALVSSLGKYHLTGSDPIATGLNIKVKITNNTPVPKRVTGVAVYRATSLSANTTQPETLYRFVEEIPILSFNHDESNGYYHYTISDTGDAEGTYEAVNGMDEGIYDLHVNYTVNTQQNGYMFIGNCKHSQITDAENFVFRSQPGKYSLFDWTKDFIQLPFVPTAMKGFMGKVYVFSDKQCAVVNPENLVIEDVIEGIGCLGPKAIIVTDSGMSWADYKNIYLASPQIRTIGDTILDVDTYGWGNISNVDKDSTRYGYDAKRKAFLIFVTFGSEPTFNRCWSYSINTNRWDLFETPKKVMDTCLTKDGSTILLLDDNRLAKFLGSTTVKLDWIWESKKLSMGNTMQDKKVRNIKAEGSDRSLITLKYKTPSNSSWESGVNKDENFTGANNSAIALSPADKAKLHWIKVQIEGTNSSAGSDTKAYATSLIFKGKRPK